MNKKLITFIILYLIFGAIYQIYFCVSYPQKEDRLPCAGIVWTPIILIGWPLFGVFDLIYGFIIRGLITLAAFVLTIIIPKTLFKK